MRDYCPSRKEQASLKQKKTKVSRRGRQQANRSSQQKKAAKRQEHWFKLFLWLVVLLASGALFLLLRQQFIQKITLKKDYKILLTQDNRPRALVLLRPQDQAVLLFDFDQLTTAFWQEETRLSGQEQENLQATFSNSFKKKLFYSYIFKHIVDEQLDYSSATLDQEKLSAFLEQAFSAFNFRAQRSFLAQKNLNWQFKELKPADFNNWTEFEATLADLSQNSTSKEQIFECPVAIINTTSEPNLAANFSEILETAAFSVIRKDSQDLELAETKIIYDPAMTACDSLLAELKKIIPAARLEANQQLAQQNRVALVVFLGDDLAELNFFFVNLFHGDF